MFLLYMILFLAACADLKSFRIPNRLIVAGYLLGLIYQIIWSDQDAFFLYPIYAFFILLLTIPLFCTGTIGGGDCQNNFYRRLCLFGGRSRICYSAGSQPADFPQKISK